MSALTPSAIIVTTSSRKDRLEGYLGVGDIELTHDDVKAIDKAGAKGQELAERKEMAKRTAKWAIAASLAAFIVVRAIVQM